MTGLRTLLSLVVLSASCLATGPPMSDDTVAASQTVDETLASYRLPTNVKPTEYTLQLEPDLRNFKFNGTVVIKLQIEEETNKLTLNSKELVLLDEIKVADSKGTPIKVSDHVLDDIREILIVILAESLKKDAVCVLTINFEGKLNDNFYGLYKTSYLDEKNQEKWLAVTHFQPTGARLVFPCWDEPAYKAIFKIEIIHDKTFEALSNMKLKESKEIVTTESKTISIFKPTQPMSTYIVAFAVVSDFKHEDKIAENVMHSVWTLPHLVNKTKYALETGIKIMKKMDLYTDSKYSAYMEKMDQIAIPNYKTGAMENWGLVMYRENYLLYEEKVTGIKGKQNVATFVAHEFAHQWFGNLISPEWWQDIWLSEGFANYFQYYILDQVEPKWRLKELFVVEALQGSAFSVDAGDNTRKMKQNPESLSKIRQLFDRIAYQKAGSVIRMISHALGEEMFQKGLKKYISDNKLKTTNEEKLCEAFQAVLKEASSNLKICEVMDGWINEEGYPVINVARNSKDNSLKISQERFLLINNHAQEEKTEWWVPISYYTESMNATKTAPTLWLEPKKTAEIKDIDKDKWYILNTQQTGYYRVNYDEKNWDLLHKWLNDDKKHTNIHVLNRAQLIDDALHLARANRSSYERALSLATYLKHETDYIPWESAFRSFQFLYDMFGVSDEFETLKTFIGKLMKTVVEHVKFEATDKEDDIMKLQRINVLKWACRAEMKNCENFVQKKLSKWIENSVENTLDVDLKSEILCAGLRKADEKTWNDTLKKYPDIKDPQERQMLLIALGCSETEKILFQYIDLALKPKESKIEEDDFGRVFKAVLIGSPKGVGVALSVLENNSDAFYKLTTTGTLSPIVKKIGELIRTEKEFLKLAEVLGQRTVDVLAHHKSMKNAEENLIWVNSHQKSIETWLKKNKDISSSAGTATFATFLIAIATLITRLY